MLDQLQSEFRIQTRCTHCGRLNWTRKKNVGLMGTCRGCGGKFTIAETHLRTCPECRELMSAEDVTCRKCGFDPRAAEQVTALSELAEAAEATAEATPVGYAPGAGRGRGYPAVAWVAGALDVCGAVTVVIGAAALTLWLYQEAARGALFDERILSSLLGGSAPLGLVVWGLLLIAIGQGLRCIRDIAINTRRERGPGGG